MDDSLIDSVRPSMYVYVVSVMVSILPSGCNTCLVLDRMDRCSEESTVSLRSQRAFDFLTRTEGMVVAIFDFVAFDCVFSNF